jgi:hypothetical protein
MSQIDGRWATFDHAQALETNLSQAELGGASLVEADLRGANLAGVLWQPTPRDVDDQGPGQDRRYTVLQKVNMKDQDLSGHDFCECRAAFPIFAWPRIPTAIYVALNRHLCRTQPPFLPQLWEASRFQHMHSM